MLLITSFGRILEIICPLLILQHNKLVADSPPFPLLRVILTHKCMVCLWPADVSQHSVCVSKLSAKARAHCLGWEHTQ